MDLPSLSSRLEHNIMRNSSSLQSPWDGVADNSRRASSPPNSSGESRDSTRPPGICVPRPLSDAEFDDIQRCFLRANARVEGYLDCSELKVYMDLRKCPITQWEAEKLLEYADPTYNYYITLQQVTNLALHFGIGTQHPLRLTRSEFELALDRSFRGGCRDINNNPVSQSPSNWDLDFQGVVNYFESRADGFVGYESPDDASEKDESDEEPIIEEIKVRERGPRRSNHPLHTSIHTPRLQRNDGSGNDPPPIRTREVGSQTHYTAYPTKGGEGGRKATGNRTTPTAPLQASRVEVEPDSDPESEEDNAVVDDEPLEPVRAIKERWERKIRQLIATNGDDFLVKLELDRIQKLAELAANKKVTPKPKYLQGVGRNKKKTGQANPLERPPNIPGMQSAVDKAPIVTYRSMRQTPVTPRMGGNDVQFQPSRLPLSTGHKLRAVVVEGGQPKKNRKEHGRNSQDVGKKRMNPQRKPQPLPPPPLPPPITPELPFELRSGNAPQSRRRRV